MAEVRRIVEVRASMELGSLDDYEGAIAALRACGVPGEAEVTAHLSGPVYLCARYAYDGDEEDVEAEDPTEPVAVRP